MSIRAQAIIVTGGPRPVLSGGDFALLERTMQTVGAKVIYVDGGSGIASQVEAWARGREVPVHRVTANWMHDGPASRTERNTTLVELARTVLAFPGDAMTEDLLEKARKRRLLIVESPGRLMAQRPTMDRPSQTVRRGPSHRPGISS
jgi:hypothetical protein